MAEQCLLSAAAAHAAIELLEVDPENIPDAELSVVVGLWDRPCAQSPRRLVRRPGRLILVPTVYWNDNFLPDFPGQAEALWYVSWDQAMQARPYWHLANRVEVVRCAVDVERFYPAGRVAAGRPWVLCRHSRDTPEKFAWDVPAIVQRLGTGYDVVFNLLGAANTIGSPADERIRALHQDAMDTAKFLQGGDLWVYAHAPFWRETACVAMLEAMACGLPALVTDAGGSASIWCTAGPALPAATRTSSCSSHTCYWIGRISCAAWRSKRGVSSANITPWKA